MFTIAEPTEEDVKNFISSQRDLEFTYSEVGATNTKLPEGFTIDLNQIQLGHGEATFKAAVDQPRCFGFAYGTLPDHVECGEERFLIAWMGSDAVWYDILAFSRPRHPLVRMSAPLARLLQKRFALESLLRVQKCVNATWVRSVP
jgi:uncharacterized protein (UPF0548 family)